MGYRFDCAGAGCSGSVAVDLRTDGPPVRTGWSKVYATVCALIAVAGLGLAAWALFQSEGLEPLLQEFVERFYRRVG